VVEAADSGDMKEKQMNAIIRTMPVALLATLGMALMAAASRAEEQHPRLLATPELLTALRAEIRKPGTHHRQVYETMKARVDASYPDNAALSKAYYGPQFQYGLRSLDRFVNPELKADNYAFGYRAREVACLTMLAMTPEEQAKYAELAYKAAMETALPGGAKASGLAGAMGAQSIALAYDWAYGAWTPQQREAVRKRAIAHLGAMLGGRGEREIGFNKGGVINGSMLCLMVAIHEEVNQKAAFEERIGFLKRHMEQAYDAWGISQEGMGYTEYPLSFAIPATYATQRAGDETLARTAATRSWWKLLPYASGFGDAAHRALQWGVSGAYSPGQGMASLVLKTVPAEHLPYYLWWYNRCEGMHRPVEAVLKFDSHRGLLPYALLCYPIGVQEKDPTGVLPASYYSELRGFAFFRNRWKDANDIQVTISADAYNAGIGWDNCNTLGLNLLAFNTRFLGQPDKGGGVAAYTTLLVDGKNTAGKASSSLGKPDTHEPAKDGGYTIVDGGAVYTGLGCESAKRHLLVKFAADKSQAVLSTLDRIKSAGQHTYTWQGNLGDQNSNDDIVATSGQEAGRPMFLLKGHNNGFVKGWVLHPAEAKVSLVEARVVRKKPDPQPKGPPAKQRPQVETPSLDKPGDADSGSRIALEPPPPAKKPAAVAPQPEEVEILRDPLQIVVKADNADIWVVMFVGQGAPPEATVAGNGLDSVLSVGERKARFDGKTNRIKSE